MHNAPNQATGEAMPAANRTGRRYRRTLGALAANGPAAAPRQDAAPAALVALTGAPAHAGTTGGPSGTTTPAVPFWPADPLLALVETYRAERDRFRASTTESDADFNADAALMHRLFEQLTHDAPRCRTTAAACAALRLVAEDMEDGRSDVQEALLLKVLEWVRQPDDEA